MAIPVAGPPERAYWVVTALYSLAFGLSLEGLIIVTYISIWMGTRGTIPASQEKEFTARDGGMGQRVKGAFLSLPAAVTTWSCLCLLAGLLVMVFHGVGEGVETKHTKYVLVVTTPLCSIFAGICWMFIIFGAVTKRIMRRVMADLSQIEHEASAVM